MAFIRKPFGRSGLRYLCAVVLDAGAVILSLYVALGLRLQRPLPEMIAPQLLSSAVVAAVVSMAIFHLVGIYRHAWRYISLKELIFLGQATIISVAASTIITGLPSSPVSIIRLMASEVAAAKRRWPEQARVIVPSGA